MGSMFRSGICIGAYVCPTGVFAVECRRTRAGLQVERTLDVPALLETPVEAADHLVRVLTSAHVPRADLAIAIRGFGVLHHILQLPPAKHDILSTVIAREVRRMEPQLVDAEITWTPLPVSSHASAADAHAAQLAASVPRETLDAFRARLEGTPYRVVHATIVPAAMMRVAEEFDRRDDVSALVATLPDGVFLGFFLGGALRLVVEPPHDPQMTHDATIVAEETELGAMFVRQQFRGAQVEHVTVVGAPDGVETEQAISARLGIPASRFALRDLTPASHVALGAVLDAQSAEPLALAGDAVGGGQTALQRALHSGAIAASAAALLLAIGTVWGTVAARQAASNLAIARARIQQDSFGLVSAQSTAQQRKLVRDALAALRFVAEDRVDLQKTIADIAAAMSPGIRVDSIAMDRVMDGWAVAVGGVVAGETSGHSVQTLHDFYRELPRRLDINDLTLERLSYVDDGSGPGAGVQFELTFAAPTPRRGQ
ncbi:MAG TPA: hypothetical protein VJ867_08245 [Gemmatimonadaceae bacterium]|nr:hypothetical protein [Gemmatimonadaceae bacterium]